MNIHIIRAEGVLQVSPCPPYISDYLRYSHRSFEKKGYQSVNKYETRMLHIPDGTGGVVTMHGFFPKICKLILKNLDTFTIEDRRAPLPEIDWERLKQIGLRDYQIDPTVEFLMAAKTDSGIINATGGYGKTILQAVTYAAWNNLNTILAIPLKEIYKQTYAKFVTLFPDKHIGRVGDGHKEISTDITITTFASLKNCAIEKCQLLLVDEIQQCTGDKLQDILSEMKPVRVFGYTATDQNLFNKADKLLKGLFGERLIHIDYPEAEACNAVVPGLVYMVRMPQLLLPKCKTVQGTISRGIKNCKERNTLIGEICKTIPNNWQTIVFVDHVADHLVNLHGCLPKGSRYLHRSTSKKDAGVYALSNKEQNEIIKEFVENQFQFLLCTDAFRAGVDVPNVRVVVQASGGSSEVEVLQEAFRGSRTLPKEKQEAFGVEPKTHFVVIDILDVHDDMLQGMSEKRMEMYKKQGWKVQIVDCPKDIDWFAYKQNKL